LKQRFQKDKKELIHSKKNIIKTLAIYVSNILISPKTVKNWNAINVMKGIFLVIVKKLKNNSKKYGRR